MRAVLAYALGPVPPYRQAAENGNTYHTSLNALVLCSMLPGPDMHVLHCSTCPFDIQMCKRPQRSVSSECLACGCLSTAVRNTSIYGIQYCLDVVLPKHTYL